MLKVAVAGYGNLGKCLEKVFEKDENISLEAVFSRRLVVCDKFVPFEKIDDYIGKIDVVAMAFGSYNDITDTARLVAGKFHTVDCYDNHSEIPSYRESIGSLANAGGKISVISAGWDPGLMSVQRALFSAYTGEKTFTFWGKGISQGHTNAVRNIQGVLDAVEFTVPKRDLMLEVRSGKKVSPKKQLHRRIVYVSCKMEDKKRIAKEIKNMPEYFLPYETAVRFTTEKKIKEMKQNMSHSGKIYSDNDAGKLYFNLETFSNPLFTAYTILAYVKAVPNLYADGYRGALDCLDIAPKYLAADKSFL